MSRQNALRYSLAAVGFVVAAAAFGAEPATPATPPKPSIVAPGDTTGGSICKSRLRPGSHIATRTCLTAAQRAAATIQTASPGVYGGLGPWGQVSTVGQSVGMSAFTAR